MFWLAMLLGLPLAAQVPGGVQRGLIAGRVFDVGTLAPVGDAVIEVVGQAPVARSDADGRFVLRGVVAGIVALRVRQIGYAPVLKTSIAVSAGKPTEVAVAMTRVVERLDAMTVRPSAFPSAPPVATPVSSTTLGSEELRRIPGTSEDVLQAISVSPGVGVTSPGRNDLIVRGGSAGENLYVVDNIEVPNINHFGTQASGGGPLSLVNIRLIESATFSAGGFGARYGDRVSSVTDLVLREGNRERLSGELNVAATQYGALLEGPIGRNTSIIANVRQSYLDLLFKTFGLAFIPTYTDATVKLTWRPTARDVVSALGVGALDMVRYNNETADNRVSNSQVLGTKQDQYFAGITWKRLVPGGVVLTTVGRTFARYRTAQYDSLQPPSPIFAANSTEGEFSFRNDLTLRATNRLTVDVGHSLRWADVARYDVALPGFARTDVAGTPVPLSVDTSLHAWRYGAYAQGTLRATARLRVTAGVRADAFAFDHTTRALSPRASALWDIGNGASLSIAAGRYQQPPQFIWLVGDTANTGRLQPFRADQVVAGIQRIIGDEWRVQLEVYAKRYDRYPARLFRPMAVLQPSGYDDATAEIPFGLEPLVSAGTGRADGAEFLVQKKLGATPFYGVASISVARARFRALDGVERRATSDLPVIVNVVGGWRPNPRWEWSARARTAAGAPYTPIATTGQQAGTLDFTRYNAQRLPPFFSVDTRLDRRWTLRRSALVTFIDITNVNFRSNVSGYQWNPRTRSIEARAFSTILPSIGINWEF
jgi:hypothetical protein